MNTAKALHRTDPAGSLFRQVLDNTLLAISCMPALLREVLHAFREIRARKRAAALNPRSQEIDALYSDLHQLMAQPSASELAERKLDRLRELQREEAAEMRSRFEASLNLASGAGLAALREARQILGRDEDPPSSNPASLHHS